MREATDLFGGKLRGRQPRLAQARLSRHQNPTIYHIESVILFSFISNPWNLKSSSPPFQQAMSSPEASSSIPFRSKKTLKQTSKSKALDHNPLSSKTPEKPPQLSRRPRNGNVALSIKEVRRAAESLRESNHKQSRDRTDLVSSARRKIASWPDDEAPVTKSKNEVGAGARLPEKYENLCEFFNCLDSSIRLLRLKGLMPTFTNICPKIECLTDRRFTYGHLAQLKFILPEVIELKRVLVLDERTSCMKPNLHVTINVDALENDGKSKSEAGNMNLRKVFRSRLVDFSKSHPQGDEVPEEILPEPFNCPKQDIHSKTIKNSSSPSLPEAISYAHTAEQPAGSATSLGCDDGFPEEIQPVPSNQLKENLCSNINIVPNHLLPMETSSEAPKTQQPAAASHLSQSFRRHFSQKVRNDVANSDKNLPEILQPPVHSVPETRLNSISFSEEPSSAHLRDSVNATPSKEISCINKVDSSPLKNASIQLTPAKLSTPARLMTATPALQPPKRCYMSPVDDSTCSPNKLVRRPPRSRSLKFDTPVKNKKMKDEVPDIDDESVDNDTPDIDGESVNSDILDILPDNLLQSIRDKERKAMEEQNPAISQAKRRQKMIAYLPKLFNMIHFLFQSINRSVITKEELIHKIISSHSDIVDRREVEEQLCLLLELVPDWISEKLASGGDLLIRINKTSSPESLRSRLEQAK